MTRMRGYRWHKTYYEWPLTLGTIAFFEDRDALLKFARSKDCRQDHEMTLLRRSAVASRIGT